MNDWRKIADAMDPPIPEQAQAKAAAMLERLTAAINPALERIPPDGLLWEDPRVGPGQARGEARFDQDPEDSSE